MADLPTRAVRAIREHEHWHQEVARLTAAIRECECPHENVGSEEDGWGSVPSCFREIADEEIEDAPADFLGPAITHKRSLAEVAAHPEIQACPACSRLCELIAERKVAKQKRGAAKRWIRTLGKIALREAPHA